MSVKQTLEHTLLKPEATKEQIIALCNEAKEYQLGGVCINACHIQTAAKILQGSGVKIVTVVGFPLGADHSEVKALAAKLAIADGADEIDMVINIGALKGGDYKLVEKDIRAVVEASEKHNVKVIIEACLLTDAEKIKACELIAKAGAAFVKTSTGFSSGGATVHDVQLLAQEAKKYGLGVKAAGGIRNLATVRAMLGAGASRIGTSGGTAIAKEEAAEN